MIYSDGISASIVFDNDEGSSKRKMKKKEKVIDPYITFIPNSENYNIVGIDPGKDDLLYFVDEHGKKLRYFY